MLTDAELLRRYAETHSEEAFKELVRRHLSMVYFAALRKLGGDVHRAQEVAQDVFVDLGRKAATLSGRPVLSGWLYISACYAAAKAVRSAQRKRVAEEKAAITNQPSTASVAEFDWKDVSPVLEDVMLQLSDRDRSAVLLRFFEGLTFLEMAAKLQLTEDGARLRLNRALDKMRASLAKRGVVSTAGALSQILSGQAVAAAPAGLAGTVAAGALKALSVTGANAAGVSIFHILAMKKTTAFMGCALAVLVTVPAVYLLQQKRNVSAKVSTDSPSAPAAPAASLPREYTPASKADAVPGDATTPRPVSTSSLDPAEAAAKAKAELLSNLSRGIIPIGALADIGNTTPRAAVESFFWAIAQGTNEDIAHMLALSDAQKQRIKAVLDNLPEAARIKYPDPEHVVAVFGAREGTIIPAQGTIEITSETVASGNEIKLKTHITTVPEQYESARLPPNNSSNINVRNGPTGWKIVVPDEALNGLAPLLAAKAKGSG